MRALRLLLAAALMAACDGELRGGRAPDGGTSLDSIEPEIPSIPGTYPRNLSWANIDTDGDGVGENYITSAKMQPCSDCYLYASLALVEARWQIDNRAAVSLNLSEQNIHNCMKIPCDGAGDIWWMLNYVRDYGVMPEENMPSGFWLPKCENCIGLAFGGLGLVPISNVPFYRISDYTTLKIPRTYAERKRMLVEALQDGPVAIGINAWKGYSNDNGTLYCADPKPEGSGHAVLVVGYLESGMAFLVKNSHGEGKLITMVFDGGEKCGFASEMIRLEPGSVYITWGWGATYCYTMVDSDGDNVPDAHDNCPWDANADQADGDADGWGNACDRCPDTKDWTGYYCPRQLAAETVRILMKDPKRVLVETLR